MKYLKFRLLLTEQEKKNTPNEIIATDNILVNAPMNSKSAFSIIPGNEYKSDTFKVDYILKNNKKFPQNYGFVTNCLMNYRKKNESELETFNYRRCNFLNGIIISNEPIVVGIKFVAKPIGLMEVVENQFSSIYVIAIGGDYLGVIKNIFEESVQSDPRIKTIHDFHKSFNPTIKINYYSVQVASRVMSFTERIEKDIDEYLHDNCIRFRNFFAYAKYIDQKYAYNILINEEENQSELKNGAFKFNDETNEVSNKMQKKSRNKNNMFILNNDNQSMSLLSDLSENEKRHKLQQIEKMEKEKTRELKNSILNTTNNFGLYPNQNTNEFESFVKEMETLKDDLKKEKEEWIKNTNFKEEKMKNFYENEIKGLTKRLADFKTDTNEFNSNTSTKLSNVNKIMKELNNTNDLNITNQIKMPITIDDYPLDKDKVIKENKIIEHSTEIEKNVLDKEKKLTNFDIPSFSKIETKTNENTFNKTFDDSINNNKILTHKDDSPNFHNEEEVSENVIKNEAINVENNPSNNNSESAIKFANKNKIEFKPLEMQKNIEDEKYKLDTIQINTMIDEIDKKISGNAINNNLNNEEAKKEENINFDDFKFY